MSTNFSNIVWTYYTLLVVGFYMTTNTICSTRQHFQCIQNYDERHWLYTTTCKCIKWQLVLHENIDRLAAASDLVVAFHYGKFMVRGCVVFHLRRQHLKESKLSILSTNIYQWRFRFRSTNLITDWQGTASAPTFTITRNNINDYIDYYSIQVLFHLDVQLSGNLMCVRSSL